MRRPTTPVPRGVVALWGLALLGAWGGIIALAENLRHPHPAVAPDVEEPADEDAGDPRIPFECPEPPPREDGADAPELGPVRLEPVAVSSDDLLDCPGFYDRRRVRFRGEAVGAVMRRSEGAWTQVNDDLYAEAGPLPGHRQFAGANAGIGVLLPTAAAADIGVIGGSRTRGDIIEVVGTFYRIDPRAREVAVIRASEVRVVEQGSRLVSPLLTDRLVAAVGLVALAGATLALQIWSHRRSWIRPSRGS